MDWCPFIKETFNGFGNAIEYLGRYTHKIAISNSRILSVTESETTFFSKRGKNPGEPKRTVTLKNQEFIRRFFDACTPLWISEIRYYGFLNNRMKTKKSKIDFQTPGLSEIQMSLYRSVYCRTTESRMEL